MKVLKVVECAPYFMTCQSCGGDMQRDFFGEWHCLPCEEAYRKHPYILSEGMCTCGAEFQLEISLDCESLYRLYCVNCGDIWQAKDYQTKRDCIMGNGVSLTKLGVEKHLKITQLVSDALIQAAIRGDLDRLENES